MINKLTIEGKLTIFDKTDICILSGEEIFHFDELLKEMDVEGDKIKITVEKVYD